MQDLQATDVVRQFCEAVNAGLRMSREDRAVALREIPVPSGYSSVVLRYADHGAFAGYLRSRNPSVGLTAMDVAVAIRMGRSSRVLRAGVLETGDDIMDTLDGLIEPGDVTLLLTIDEPDSGHLLGHTDRS